MMIVLTRFGLETIKCVAITDDGQAHLTRGGLTFSVQAPDYADRFLVEQMYARAMIAADEMVGNGGGAV